MGEKYPEVPGMKEVKKEEKQKVEEKYIQSNVELIRKHQQKVWEKSYPNKKWENRPRQFRFLILDSLTGCGKQLRQMGCDAEFCKPGGSLMSKCLFAIEENRILLHQGRDFNLVRRCIQQQIDSEKQTIDQYCFDIELPKKVKSADKKSSKVPQQSGLDQAKIIVEKLGIRVMK